MSVITPVSSVKPVPVAGPSPTGPLERPSPFAVQGPLMGSPRMHLDGQLGLVVLEFRNQDGKLTRTLPTERELAAYRRDLALPAHHKGAKPVAAAAPLAGADSVAGANAVAGAKPVVAPPVVAGPTVAAPVVAPPVAPAVQPSTSSPAGSGRTPGS